MLKENKFDEIYDKFILFSTDLNNCFSGNSKFNKILFLDLEFENFFRILVEYKTYINSEIINTLKKDFNFDFDNKLNSIDNLFLYKNKLIGHVNNREKMLNNPSPFKINKHDFVEFFHICEYLYKPEFSCEKIFFMILFLMSHSKNY